MRRKHHWRYQGRFTRLASLARFVTAGFRRAAAGLLLALATLLVITAAAEGQIPNRSYPSNELFTKISPQLGDRHHNQPTVINGYLLLAGNAVHEFWDISNPYPPVRLSELFSPHRFGEAESHQVSYAKSPNGRLYLVTISGRGIDLWRHRQRTRAPVAERSRIT